MLTGKETSVFGMLQADIKAYQELYKDEDINAYYTEFKAVNDLDGGRKLKPGEEIQFPHTQKSRELKEAEEAAAAKAAAKAERRAALERERAARAEQEAAGETASPEDSSDPGALFGSDTRSHTFSAEEQRKQARQRAASSFVRSWFRGWLYSRDLNSAADDIDELTEAARSEVDAPFAEALNVHRYPEKNIVIIAFEPPAKQGDYYYVAIKTEPDAAPVCYALEKGLSIFGTGDVSVLVEWRSEWSSRKLGGRNYSDLSRFLAEVEAGQKLYPEGD